MGKIVKLYDTLTITPTSVDQFREGIKDAAFLAGGAVSNGRSLLVDVVATHAGRLTRNNGFYLPKYMRDGARTMFEQYPKPVLKHHNAHDDAIGRIINAEYIDNSNQFIRDMRTKDSALVDALEGLCRDNVSFIGAVNFIDELAKSQIIRDPDYPGLGHIKATLEITDADAIQKVLNKQYLTVSTGAATNKAVCSICKTDWASEGAPCEHRPGKEYDGKLCFLIAGQLKYDECSFVNVPADSLASVVSIVEGQTTLDSRTVESHDSYSSVGAIFSFSDFDNSIGGKDNMDKAKEAWEKLQQELAKEDLAKEDAVVSLEKFVDEYKENEEAKDIVTEAQTKLDEIKKEDVVEGRTSDTALVAAVRSGDMEMVELLVSKGADVNKKDKWGDLPLTVAASNGHKEIASFLIEKGADVNAKDEVQAEPEAKLEEEVKLNDEAEYEDMFKFGVELGLFEDDFNLEDAKLSTKQRKKLSKSTFCKPGERKYPVPDCNHAKVAMAYAKKNNESSSVVSCIRSKAKALGCAFGSSKKDEYSDEFEPAIEKLVKDWVDAQNNGGEETIVDNKQEGSSDCDCDNLKDHLAVLRSEYRDLQVEYAELADQHTDEFKALKTTLIDTIVDLKKLKGEEVVVDELNELSSEKLVNYATELKDGLNIDQIAKKLNDGMARQPEDGTVDDPTLPAKAPEDQLLDADDGEDEYKQYKDVYKNMEKTKGFDVAQKYLRGLREARLVPVDFDPIQ